MPSSVVSRPLISASSLTRMPTVAFRMNQTIADTHEGEHHRQHDGIKLHTKARSLFVKVTAIVPQIPANKCTGIAPTTSSIFSLSRKGTAKTTITPPTAPIKVATQVRVSKALP